MQGYKLYLCSFTISHGSKMVMKRERTISSNWASERTSYFFKNEKPDRFCKYHKNELWMSKIECLSEIFRHVNSLNSNMQGRNENILTATDKLVAFKKKVAIWKKRMREDNLDTFSLVQKTCVTEMIPITGEHLTCLENKI